MPSVMKPTRLPSIVRLPISTLLMAAVFAHAPISFIRFSTTRCLLIALAGIMTFLRMSRT